MSAGTEAVGGWEESHRERILALSQRLENLQSSLQLEGSRRFEALEQKLGAVEGRIVEAFEVGLRGSQPEFGFVTPICGMQVPTKPTLRERVSGVPC